MALPRDKEPDTGDKLLDAELNPLTNPVLGQNLGQWAQVYYMNPPEKREQALAKLLHDLETKEPHGVSPSTAATSLVEGTQPPIETPSHCDSEQPNISFAESAHYEAARYEAARYEAAQRIDSCPTCQRRNKPDHAFCVFCGSSLKRPWLKQTPINGNRDSRSFSPDSFTKQPSSPKDAESQLQALRDNAFLSLQASEPPPHPGKKILMAVLAICLSAFAYQQWHSIGSSKTVSGARQSVPEQTQPASSTSPTSRTPGSSQGSAGPKAAHAESSSGESYGRVKADARRPGVIPASESQVNSPPTDTAGIQELLRAKRYLETAGSARDSAEAAKWLWKAVGKENGTASVLLADLYMSGDGVPKSCDQARLLLVAAAKKGGTEAGQKLRYLENGGCK